MQIEQHHYFYHNRANEELNRIDHTSETSDENNEGTQGLANPNPNPNPKKTKNDNNYISHCFTTHNNTIGFAIGFVYSISILIRRSFKLQQLSEIFIGNRITKISKKKIT